MAAPIAYKDLKYVETGPKGRPVLFFIHGWPDTADLWKREMAAFSPDYHCVAVTLPGFDGKMKRYWGYDFPALVEMLADTIAEVTKQTASESPAADSAPAKVVLIGHDWGAYLCYLLEQKHPELVSTMITLDVGAHIKPTNWQHALSMAAYQWWLLMAFVIGRFIPFIGNLMTRRFSQKMGAPRGRNVHNRMNYPYLYIWRGQLLKKYHGSLLRRYKPKVPLLFLFGAKQKYNFHSPKWEKIVQENPKNKMVPFPCGHWLSVERPELTISYMEEWVADHFEQTAST